MRSSALAFLAGVLLVHQMASVPSLWWALLLLPLAVAALRRPIWLIPLCFVAGIAWTAFRAGLILADSLPPALEGRDILIEGHVADLPRPTDFGQRFVFDVARAEVDGAPVAIPARLLLSARERDAEEGRAPEFTAGSRWRLTVRLKRPHGFANPGGFDYEAYLFRNRIRARGYVRAKPPPQRLEAFAPARFVYRINHARGDIGAGIHGALPSSAFAGIVAALANGDQSGINDEQWQVLRRTGTLHLIAISGLHISLVAGLVFLLTRFCWSLPGRTVLWAPAPGVGAIAALMAALIYAALAGFTIPTQRALIMVAVAMVAVISRRRMTPSWVLAAALLAVLVHDPFAVMAAGFWLSFAAVAVIVLVMQGGEGLRAGWHKLATLQWAIALGMLPLMLVLFQQTSLIAPLANMIAVPMFDLLIVPLTLFGVALHSLALDSLGGLALALAAWLLQLLWYALEAMSALAWAQWVQHEPPLWAAVLAGVGAVILLAPRGWPARWLGFAWLAPLVLVRPPAPAVGEMHFALLDVGQGLAAVVRTAGHTLVYDTGPRFSPRFDTGAAVVVPYLRAKGVRRIDALVISHGDNDHIGGLASVRAALPTGRTISNVVDPALAPEPCRAGMRWQWEGVEFAVLGPSPDANVASNDGSCVLHIASRHGSVLLPGDIERRAERSLLERAPAGLAATVLVAPHHGSRTSSTAAFIDAVAPRQVLFAAGYRSRYGHPHPAVVRRYAERGIAALGSASAGAIEISFDASGTTVRRDRQEAARFWRSL